MLYRTKKPSETRELAKKLTKEISKTSLDRSALVIGFAGELGTGKTTFIKSFVRSMGVSNKVTSPTFLILRRFKMPKGKNFKNIFHIDAYRIEKESELSDVGLEDILDEPQNIVLIEWADRVKGVLPKKMIWVKLKYGKERDERKIIID